MSSSRATARAASSGGRAGTFRGGEASYRRPGRGVLEDKGLSITFNEKGQETRFLRALDELGSIAMDKFGPEMKILVKYSKETTFVEPTPPDKKDKTEGLTQKYSIEYRSYERKQDTYRKEKAQLFDIIMGALEPNLKSKVEANSEYAQMEATYDVKGLLDKLSDMIFMHEGAHEKFWAMQMSLRTFANINQGPHETNDFYHYRFMGYSKAIVKQWGAFYPDNLAGGASDSEKKAAQDKMLAMIFLGGVDKRRYGSMLASLNNSFLNGEDKYPASVNDALNVLQLWQDYGQGTGPRSAIDSERVRPGSETSFTQTNRQLARLRCFECDGIGHYARNCPERRDRNQNRNGSSNAQTSGRRPNTGWDAQLSESDSD